MFTITGLINGQSVTVTWDNGSVDNSAITDYLTREIESRQGLYSSPSQQACLASMEDSLFCYEMIIKLFDSVESFEGDCGLITGPDGVVF